MDAIKDLFYNIKYIDYDSIATKSTLNSHQKFFDQLMRMDKKELAATLVNYSYTCNNDKSTGTTLEAAISQVMGANNNRLVKHGYDSSYDNGNTLEIKPENVYYPIWNGQEYIPSNSKRLNMLGKYNDFTWHAIIRYISGMETNSNNKMYYKEISDFIINHYEDKDYRNFMLIACKAYGRVQEFIKSDKNWWNFIQGILQTDSLEKTKKEWSRIVKKIHDLKGTVKPNKWNKYHVSGGSVGGKLVYVARIDFPIVYERLFEKMLYFYPPEKRFQPVKSRCQIDFNYKCLNSGNLQCVKWVYVDNELLKYKKCISKDFLDIILLCNPRIVESKVENINNSFEELF